jgi:hypothetical protein
LNCCSIVKTIASKDLTMLKFNEREIKLLKQWDLIIENAKKTFDFKPLRDAIVE